MARKTIVATIEDEGRDRGKVFVGTEMSAVDTEDLGLQAVLALSGSGVSVPDNLLDAGLAGIAQIGFQSLSAISFADAKPIFDRLMSCWRIRPDPRHPDVVRDLCDDDIEEWRTRLKLRLMIFRLHVDFSAPADQSTLTSNEGNGSAGSAPPQMLPRGSRKS